MTRRAHQCHKDGCDSEANWSVSISFLCMGMGIYRRRLSCDSTIKVCGRHCDDAMEFILSPINRSRISFWLDSHNYPPPDFETAKVEFTRVDHDAIEADTIAALMEQE